MYIFNCVPTYIYFVLRAWYVKCAMCMNIFYKSSNQTYSHYSLVMNIIMTHSYYIIFNKLFLFTLRILKIFHKHFVVNFFSFQTENSMVYLCFKICNNNGFNNCRILTCTEMSVMSTLNTRSICIILPARPYFLNRYRAYKWTSKRTPKTH